MGMEVRHQPILVFPDVCPERHRNSKRHGRWMGQPWWRSRLEPDWTKVRTGLICNVGEQLQN